MQKITQHTVSRLKIGEYAALCNLSTVYVAENRHII